MKMRFLSFVANVVRPPAKHVVKPVEICTFKVATHEPRTFSPNCTKLTQINNSRLNVGLLQELGRRREIPDLAAMRIF